MKPSPCLAAVLAGALAFPVAAGALDPAVGTAPHCLHAPVITAHPDDRHVVVLAAATGDTVPAGWGDVTRARTGRRPRGWGRQPVYGQVAEVSGVGGPAASGVPGGRAVLVPWEPGCDNLPLRWWRSFAWLRTGEPDAVVGRLRSPEHWAGGIPTIDVFRPELMRASGLLPGAVRWRATADQLFGFYSTLPSIGRIQADPWPAVAPMLAWLRANPALAQVHPIRYAARAVHEQAAHTAVRSAPSPLAGTYRFEVSRTGGPAHTIFVRTTAVPERAIWSPGEAEGLVFPGAAAGYQLRMVIRESESSLPRRIAGRGRDDGRIDVRLPEAREADGSRRFRGHLELVEISHRLRNDPELREAIYAWFDRWTENMQNENPVAEIVLRPDGSVQWSQVMEVAPGRVVTIRGVRVAPETL
ncbi:MAG TPA: hypothetical protein VHG08_05220 [Longimicrobium sp.]|nr:hypothetical protein [Longimicrobium sp.]